MLVRIFTNTLISYFAMLLVMVVDSNIVPFKIFNGEVGLIFFFYLVYFWWVNPILITLGVIVIDWAKCKFGE